MLKANFWFFSILSLYSTKQIIKTFVWDQFEVFTAIRSSNGKNKNSIVKIIQRKRNLAANLDRTFEMLIE